MNHARTTRLNSRTKVRLRKPTILFRQPALSRVCGLVVVIFVANVSSMGSLSAQELKASNGATDDSFGRFVSLSGNTGLVGEFRDDDNGSNSGAAYVFRGLDTATGTVNESVKLTASDGAAGDIFGDSVSLSGNTGLVAAPLGNNTAGSAYVFRGLDTATGTVNESVKLTASDGAATDRFGNSVSLSGNKGLVGARDDNDNGRASGSAYVFRGLDTATGTVNESVKLTASDGAATDRFGGSVSLSGNTGLVAAPFDDDNGSASGSAYVFRGLDTATGTVNESVKLTASDGATSDLFGGSVSLSGNTGLVGANADDDNGSGSGSAYVFRGLDTATGTVNESVKLTASDGAAQDQFGGSVSLSGNTGLVGAPFDDDNGRESGSAYVFRRLDTVTGTVRESVKLTVSGGARDNRFGSSVSLDEDRFVIGAPHANIATVDSGSAYTGTVSSMTTLDTGDAAATIFGISFDSRIDWIIGETTDRNHVMLTQGNTGKVLESGAGIFIGANAGSNENSLTIAGILEANDVTVGAEGNFGNAFILDATAIHTLDAITLFSNNSLLLEGDYTLFSLLDEQLDMADLFVSINGDAQRVTETSFDSLLSTHFDSVSGYTSFTAIPEPSAVCLVMLGLTGLALRRERR